jgi:hypothetical protein
MELLSQPVLKFLSRQTTVGEPWVSPSHLYDLLHNLWVNVTHAGPRDRPLTPIQQQLCGLCGELLLLLLLLRLRIQLLFGGLAVW